MGFRLKYVDSLPIFVVVYEVKRVHCLTLLCQRTTLSYVHVSDDSIHK